MHTENSEYKGQTVRIKAGVTDPVQNLVVEGAKYEIEEWWDKLTGGSWHFAKGNPAAVQYAVRAAFNNLPLDDEVLYGKIDRLGHLVHISEIEEL
ncbi:MAG: hypothetical protein ACREOB_07030 [Thermodesulfobacteriota bacterium]